MDTKQVLKIAGKVALTIASPPIGLETTVKNAKTKSIVFTAGVTGCILFNILGESLIRNNQLYDNPSVSITTSPQGIRNFPSLVLSPLAYWLDRSQPFTLVECGDRKYLGISGDNVFSYDKNTGNYVLNFNESIKFIKTYRSITLPSQFDSLADTRNELESNAEEGVVINSRGLAEAYTKKKTEYAEVQKTLEGVVSKMNAELEDRRSKLTEKVK